MPDLVLMVDGWDVTMLHVEGNVIVGLEPEDAADPQVLVFDTVGRTVITEAYQRREGFLDWLAGSRHTVRYAGVVDDPGNRQRLETALRAYLEACHVASPDELRDVPLDGLIELARQAS